MNDEALKYLNYLIRFWREVKASFSDEEPEKALVNNYLIALLYLREKHLGKEE